MEFDAEDAVAEIDQARARILLDDVFRTRWSDACRFPTEVSQGFERPKLPPEPPPHCVIDVATVVRDHWCDAFGIFERRNERRPQKLAHFVLTVDERSNSLADIVDTARGVERGQPYGVFRAVLHGD